MHETPIWDRMAGRWKEVLPQLGNLDLRTLDGRHRPCPLCGGKDRWRFDDKQGSGSSICGQCGAKTGMQLLMALNGWDFGTAAREIEALIGDSPAPATKGPATKTEAEKYAEAKAFWRAGGRIASGDPVDLYLKHRVGTYAPTRALKFIPATPFSGTMYPAMVAAFVDVHGELAGIQRTFLTPDGRKANLDPARWNTGALPDGGAVRLAPYDKVLGIAEGVETALAATRLFGLPVWAALTENRVEVWEPPEGVNEIVVFGDCDGNFVGQSAAYSLARRLSRDKTRTVQVMIPPEVGKDWNDELASMQRTQ